MHKISIQLAEQIRRAWWFRFVAARVMPRVAPRTRDPRVAVDHYSDPQSPLL
jgi:hypothetical protein